MISIDLPPNETWYLLKSDGTLSDSISSVDIRNVEGAILYKGSALENQANPQKSP